MITCQWDAGTGWEAPRLVPYGPISLMPTASVLQYATTCFEGMKIYRGFDGKLRLFRPDRNCARMLVSSTRISLPGFPPEEFQKLIETLMSVDGPKWLPKSRPGAFLYLRPTMIGNSYSLGVQKPKRALLYIMACCFPPYDDPSGSLGPPRSVSSSLGVASKPGLKLLASREDTIRAWPGGFGYAKVGANYGPSLLAQGEARERGYDQILWLLGADCQITEAGASNFFVVWRNGKGQIELVTAPLDDKVILDGVVRRSVLELAAERLSKQHGNLEPITIVQRRFTMSDLLEANANGQLLEAFAAGTAFFISPVSIIHSRGQDLDFELKEDGGTIGPYAKVLKAWLKAIMYGEEAHRWGVVVPERGVPV